MRKSRRLLESVNYTVLALSVSALDNRALFDTPSNWSLNSNFSLHDKQSNGSSAPASALANPYDLSGNFNPSMAIIVVVLLSAFFFMGFFSLYVRRCSGEDDSVTGGGGGNGRMRNSAPQGLDKSIIETFPVFNYSLVKGLKQGKEALECAVCLSEFEDDEALRFMPKCGHAFHPDCIDMWLFSHSTCPLCRTSLVPDSNKKEQGVNSTSQPQQAAAEHVVIFVGAVNEVQNRADDQVRGGANQNAELHGPSPGQARACNEQRSLIDGLRPLEKPRLNFRRSHSTGHSLIRLGGNPDHPSEFFISTDDRHVLDILQEPIRCPMAGLHRSSSYAAICHAESESQNDRERLWRCPSSAEPIALQEVIACTHPHSSRGAEVEADLEFARLSQTQFNPRISSDRCSIPLHSPVFLRTFSDSRTPYFQQ